VGKNPDNPWNLVVWNLNPAPFDGYVEGELQWLHEFPAYKGGIELEDVNGKKYPCQIIMEGSVIEGFRSRVLFKTQIDGLGYKCFKVIKTDKPDSISDYKRLKKYATGELEIEFDDNSGFIKSLKNKKNGKVVFYPVKPAVLEDKGDTWCFNVNGYGGQVGEFKLKDFEVVEKGIYRTTVKTVHSFNNSLITLYYTFYNNEDYFDIKYCVNWNEKHNVLKLICDFGYGNLLVSSPFASEQRQDTERDNPMGEWLSLTDNDSGVAMIFDSAFAYNKKGTSLGVSLLRSCIYGDLRISELDKNADYPYMEQGITEGKIRIITFTGATKDDISDKASAFNNPPKVICEANHEGVLCSAGVFVDFDGQGVSVTAIKVAYDGSGDIIRLNEYLGMEQTVKIKYFDTDFVITMKPYEIKTLLISDGKLKETNIIEQ
jgi:alpha-mannosidase